MKKIIMAVVLLLLAGFAYADDMSDALGITTTPVAAASPISAESVSKGLSSASLIWALIFNSVGVFAFILGKNKSNAAYIVIGVLLEVYPYIVQDTMWIIIIGAVLTAGLYFFKRNV